jgi:hypothetical protein
MPPDTNFVTQQDLINAVQSATLATQMSEVIKDVQLLSAKVEGHENRHRANVKWGIGLACTVIGSNAGVILALIRKG